MRRGAPGKASSALIDCGPWQEKTKTPPTCIAVDAKLEALAVNVVGNGLDAVGKDRLVHLQVVLYRRTRRV